MKFESNRHTISKLQQWLSFDYDVILMVMKTHNNMSLLIIVRIGRRSAKCPHVFCVKPSNKTVCTAVTETTAKLSVLYHLNWWTGSNNYQWFTALVGLNVHDQYKFVRQYVGFHHKYFDETFRWKHLHKVTFYISLH